MTSWPLTPLSPDPDIRVTPSPREEDAATEEAISRIWEEGCNAQPRLFNGRIFVADQITGGQITGHWDEYRRAFAQIRAPELFRTHPLRQLAVCGLLICADGVVAGRRAPPGAYMGGYWQTPPAGTVESREGGDQVCLRDQLLAEATEELGLAAEQLHAGDVLFAVTHPKTWVTDIAIMLHTELPFAAIRDSWQNCGNKEYDCLTLIRHEDVPDWLAGDWKIAPTTRYMLEHLIG
ncbi:hypothetical protein LOC54_08395 [Acetobacter sp. AN02]|uniref:hypothetical protein n=1 Tax=Acetobacter sp. AN02 TaxID=2894186 RepID=UPI002434630C|nr:hypothetical protein [Acetobacter sp. AN02]MDG6095129.1 hypothetical protein [Acetobacter sp. AN02]